MPVLAFAGRKVGCGNFSDSAQNFVTIATFIDCLQNEYWINYLQFCTNISTNPDTRTAHNAPLRNVWWPQPTTLKFLLYVAFYHKVSLGPRYRLCRPLATGLEKPRKSPKSIFGQNGGDNYFRFRFWLRIRILRLNLVNKRVYQWLA